MIAMYSIGFKLTIAIFLTVFRPFQATSTVYKNFMCVHGNVSNFSRLCSSPYHISNFTEILVNSSEVVFYGHISLSQLLRVESKSDIKFRGVDAAIQCSHNAGFLFMRVQNISIDSVELQNCGAWTDQSSSISEFYNTQFLFASIFVLDCVNVDFIAISVFNSTGMDLFMKSTVGSANIIGCHFMGIRPVNQTMTGVHVEVAEDSIMIVRDCVFGKFQCNNGSRQSNSTFAVIFGNGSNNNTISITNCRFCENCFLQNVGALYVMIKSNASDNLVRINDSKFIRNVNQYRHGGAVRVDVIEENGLVPSGNHLHFFNLSFVRNSGKLGGAVFLNSSKTSTNCFIPNTISFSLCEWTNNSARYGSAIDAVVQGERLLGKLLLLLLLRDCTFYANYINAAMAYDRIVIYGKGVISASYFSIIFNGDNVFKDNIGSPLYLSSSSAKFGENSSNTFTKNIGLDGGAISLLGHSFIEAHSGSVFNFTENIAYFKGGAIAHITNDGHDYITNNKCFFQYIRSKRGAEVMPRFYFKTNRAGYQDNRNENSSTEIGRSIYATTLVPCNRECGHYKYLYTANIHDSFSCVGHFQFDQIREYEVATGEWFIYISNKSSPLEIIPGKVYNLPVETLDELNQTLNSVYKVVLWKANSKSIEAKVAPSYRFGHKNQVVLYGSPSEDKYELRLSTEHNREIRLSIYVMLVPCPPGYSLNQSVCKCSADLEAKDRHQSILQCNRTKFQAKLQSGFWVGYGNTSNYTTLISSACPRGFCSLFSNSKPIKYYMLPKSFQPMELDELLCGKSRTGRLCSACRGNHSAFFHSYTLKCKPNRHCKLGWLFYGMSELLPVTGIFLVVIGFDVQLTSGSVNGLILYYQLLNNMLITGNDFIRFPEAAYDAYKAHRFFSQMFNFNFFVTSKLSFCLWEGATSLDVLAFKYFTVTYSLIMVLLTILVMKTFSLNCVCFKLRRSLQRREISNSVIHGLSGFFVLSYSVCTQVSLQLLKPVQYTDPSNSLNGQKYVQFSGEMRYFQDKHLKYALPALFFIFAIVIIPPALLIAYPLCYKILAFFKLEESWFSRLLCRVIPLERVKPFFDSFQGSFKDKHRYTSGLYFAYRFLSVSLAVNAILNSILFYILFEMLLLIMIFVHAYCQPYKSKSHNRLDLFVFVNLAIINALTIFSFWSSMHVLDQQPAVNVATSIQVIFIYLPTFYIACKIGYYLILLICKCRTTNKAVVVEDDTELFERYSDQNELMSSREYTLHSSSSVLLY